MLSGSTSNFSSSLSCVDSADLGSDGLKHLDHSLLRDAAVRRSLERPALQVPIQAHRGVVDELSPVPCAVSVPGPMIT
eukprot:3247215-Rhodomonas_salina.3